MNYIIDDEGFYCFGEEKLTKDEFDMDYFICAECDMVFPKDKSVKCNTDGKLFCNDCADKLLIECARCGNFIYEGEEMYFPDSDDAFCEHCFDYHTNYVCEHCGVSFRYAESGEYDRYDEWYCDGCREDGYGCFSSGLIGSYHDFKSHSSELCFMGDESRTEEPYLGFELEVDNEDGDVDELSAAKYIDSRFGSFFHMEEDGSLDSGFEIISQPSSIQYHLSRMPDYADMFKYLVKCGYNSHNARTCGLHIHIDKKYFGSKLDSSIAKMLYVFEKHWENLVRFSRRNYDQIGDWCGRYSTKPTKVVKDMKSGSYIGRYHAINLTNSNTIEIRLWRGSLRSETFEATLKLTARIAELCKTKTAVELHKMNFEQLLGDDEVIKSYWDTVKNRSV